MTTVSAESPALRLRVASKLAEEVQRDLALAPKQLQSKYLYDSVGSALFEVITRLPWYRITRAEMSLLTRHAQSIAMAMDDPATIVELGCGSGEKLALLVEARRRLGRAVRVHLIDISPSALESSERRLGRIGKVSVVGHRSTYEDGLRRAAAQRPAQGSMNVLFLGSNIGNFDPPAALGFLAEVRSALRPGDGLLIGVDLVKDQRDLLLAYDDPLGVTAAFNKNLLVRINAELGADFHLDRFDHRAVWNAHDARVEMHLVSQVRQMVNIPGAECRVSFEAGEFIWTESSYKYTPSAVSEMGTAAGFACQAQWIEPEARFALTLFRAK